MKVIEESDGDEYGTDIEDGKVIKWYSTNQLGETIVDQLYRSYRRNNCGPILSTECRVKAGGGGEEAHFYKN